MLEAVTGILLIGIVLGATAYLTVQFGRTADHTVNRRRAMLAAEARIEAMRAGTLQRPAFANDDAEDGMHVEVRSLEGDPRWLPLRLVECRAVTRGRDGKEIAVAVRAYVHLRPEIEEVRP